MTVLAATDFSEPSNRAIRVAGREARLRGESLTVVHALRLEADGGSWWRVFDSRQIDPDRLHRRARRRLESAVYEHLPSDCRPNEVQLRTTIDSPAESIRQLVERLAPCLVVLGATGRGSFESAVLGSTAEELIRSVTPPVLTVPAESESGSRSAILVPVDFSECSEYGIASAAEIARQEEARLLVMHEAILHSTGVGRPSVSPSDDLEQNYREEFEKRLAVYLQRFDLEDLPTELLVNVQPYETRSVADGIVGEAERHEVDLIVMGTHGHRGFRRFLLGSTTLEVLHRMPAPLLTVCAEHRRPE